MFLLNKRVKGLISCRSIINMSCLGGPFILHPGRHWQLLLNFGFQKSAKDKIEITKYFWR